MASRPWTRRLDDDLGALWTAIEDEYGEVRPRTAVAYRAMEERIADAEAARQIRGALDDTGRVTAWTARLVREAMAR